MLSTQHREQEAAVEERVARLETHVEHIRSDLSDVKIHVRELGHHVRELDHKVDSFRLALEQSLLKATVWALGLYFALATTLLGVMAKGFGWIP